MGTRRGRSAATACAGQAERSLSTERALNALRADRTHAGGTRWHSLQFLQRDRDHCDLLLQDGDGVTDAPAHRQRHKCESRTPPGAGKTERNQTRQLVAYAAANRLCLSVSLSLCLSVSLAHHCIQRGMPRIEPASIASSFASLS